MILPVCSHANIFFRKAGKGLFRRVRVDPWRAIASSPHNLREIHQQEKIRFQREHRLRVGNEGQPHSAPLPFERTWHLILHMIREVDWQDDVW